MAPLLERTNERTGGFGAARWFLGRLPVDFCRVSNPHHFNRFASATGTAATCEGKGGGREKNRHPPSWINGLPVDDTMMTDGGLPGCRPPFHFPPCSLEGHQNARCCPPRPSEMIPHRNHTPKPRAWEKEVGWGMLPVGVEAEKEGCHASWLSNDCPSRP